MRMLLCVFVLLAALHCTFAAQILGFFPLPWKSHQFVCRALMKALALKGHKVDYYTTLPMENPPANLNQFKLSDRIEEIFEENHTDEVEDASVFELATLEYDLHIKVLKNIFTRDQNFDDLIRSNNTYDLLITESAMWSDPVTYLAHKFDVPFVNLFAAPDYPWANEVSGLSDNPSYMPSFLNSYTERSFIGRLKNFYTTQSLLLVSYWVMMNRMQTFCDEHVKYDGWESRPPLTAMAFDAALVLVNSHVSFSHPHPKAPHVKEVGGLHVDPEPAPLPRDLQKFMDDAHDGIIYFSLGSFLDPKQLLADGKFEIFLKVFGKLKQKIMWKVAPNTPAVDNPNIKLQTWYPQQSILAHKNVVLFITHGGFQSMVESISAGVPCIGMPVFYDQHKDVDMFIEMGTGIKLTFDNVTEESLNWAINELLSNPSYTKEVQGRRKLYHDRPIKPREEAVYWVEYVLKFGKVMQPASVHMPFYQLHLLDIYALALFAIAIFLYSAKKIVCLINRSVFSKNMKKNRHNKKKE